MQKKLALFIHFCYYYFSYIKESLLSSIFMVIAFENYWEYFETTLTSDAQSGLLIIKSWFSQMYCNFSGLPQLSPILWQLVVLKTFCNATYFNLSSTTVCTSDVTCVFSRLFWFITNENKPMTSCIRNRDCRTSVLITTLLETTLTVFSSGNKVLLDTSHTLFLLLLQVKFSLDICRIDGLVEVAILVYLNFPYTELILKKSVKYILFKAT